MVHDHPAKSYAPTTSGVIGRRHAMRKWLVRVGHVRVNNNNKAMIYFKRREESLTLLLDYGSCWEVRLCGTYFKDGREGKEKDEREDVLLTIIRPMR